MWELPDAYKTMRVWPGVIDGLHTDSLEVLLISRRYIADTLDAIEDGTHYTRIILGTTDKVATWLNPYLTRYWTDRGQHYKVLHCIDTELDRRGLLHLVWPKTGT